MRRILFVFVLLAGPTILLGEDAVGIIDVSDKAAIDAAMGKEVIVEGVIDEARWSRSGKVMNIEFENTEKSRLLAVCRLITSAPSIPNSLRR